MRSPRTPVIYDTPPPAFVRRPNEGLGSDFDRVKAQKIWEDFLVPGKLTMVFRRNLVVYRYDDAAPMEKYSFGKVLEHRSPLVVLRCWTEGTWFICAHFLFEEMIYGISFEVSDRPEDYFLVAGVMW